jgi:hypothetical protein
MSLREGEVYLGDGLYASVDPRGAVVLRAPRIPVDHWVALEPEVLEAFELFVARRLRAADMDTELAAGLERVEVEDLRRIADELDKPSGNGSFATAIRDAADELERLRAR